MRGKWGSEAGRKGKQGWGRVFQVSLSLPPTQPVTQKPCHKAIAHSLEGTSSSTLSTGLSPSTITYWSKSSPWTIIFPVPLVYGLLPSLNLLGGYWESQRSVGMELPRNWYGFYHSKHNDFHTVIWFPSQRSEVHKNFRTIRTGASTGATLTGS